MKEERFKGIISLDGPKRYDHFVKSVVDREEAWGLYADGWALSGLDDGTEAFCLWPEKEFAAACADREWKEYEPQAIPLEEFIGGLIPKLVEDGVALAVFPTPEDKGVFPDLKELLEDLKNEELRYL